MTLMRSIWSRPNDLLVWSSAVVRPGRQTAQCLRIPRVAKSMLCVIPPVQRYSILQVKGRSVRHVLQILSKPGRRDRRTEGVRVSKASRRDGLHFPLLLISNRFQLGFHPHCQSVQILTSRIPPNSRVEHLCGIPSTFSSSELGAA